MLEFPTLEKLLNKIADDFSIFSVELIDRFLRRGSCFSVSAIDRQSGGQLLPRIRGSIQRTARLQDRCSSENSDSYFVFSANVRGQGTRHLVEGTLDPLVGTFNVAH